LPKEAESIAKSKRIIQVKKDGLSLNQKNMTAALSFVLTWMMQTARLYHIIGGYWN